MTFDDFGFDELVMDGVRSMGFENPTPIQQQAIPLILEGKDIVACAQTGTGKTAAYVLPIIDQIVCRGEPGLHALILAPTRELAMQIDREIEGFSYYGGVSSIPIYGGTDGSAFEQQKQALIKGANIVIATPGRLIQQLTLSDFRLDTLQTLVLDEADRMLDMGFFDDIMRIISHIPADRQTLLFSATMPPRIRQLAERILRDPEEVTIAIAKPAEGINQQVCFVGDGIKEKLVIHLLKKEDYGSTIIFASRKETVKRLARELQNRGLQTTAFHSDLEQAERQAIMQDFKNKKVRVLVGTDVLSRGIDVEDIGLVLNFDCPPDPEDYVHRIGRTARAERKGTAITFVNEMDRGRFTRIERLIGRSVNRMEVPAEIGKGIAEKGSSGETRSFSRPGGKGKGGSGGGGNRGGKGRGGPHHKGRGQGKPHDQRRGPGSGPPKSES